MIDRRLRFVAEELLGNVEGGGVAMLFVLNHASNTLYALHHLRVGIAHVFGDKARQLVEIRVGVPNHTRIANRAAHDFPQDIPTSFVGRYDTVVNQKRARAHVVGIDAQHRIRAIVFAVFLA